MDMIERFFQHAEQSFFLFGPRGTGKSTWVHRHLPNSFVIDLLAPDVYRIYSGRPERLRDVLEAQHNTRTIVIVESYFSILEDLLLAFRLPVFTKRAKRHLSSHPKFYIFDAGVFRSIRPTGPLDRPQEIDGGALEGLVAQHIRAWISYSRNLADLYFWRTKSGNEVDFVIYGENVFCAIEVKNTANLRSKSVNSLVAFKEDYPEAEVCLLYRGQERIFHKKVLCLPCEEFLRKLVPGKTILF